MQTLDALAVKYDCDKSSQVHGYTSVYDGLFPPRDQPITLLELGIDRGSSIKLWREYFPHATIIGVDSYKLPVYQCVTPTNNFVPNFHMFQVDQADPQLPELVAPWCPLDVVIDDCSHLAEKSIASFDLLWNCVKAETDTTEGGLYIIEDIQPEQRDMMVNFLDGLDTTYSMYPSHAGRGEWLAVVYREKHD